jgi:hypothetical protein
MLFLPAEQGLCYYENMEIILHIPDELAARLATTGDLERRALEALALEEFKLGHLTKRELRRMLGLGRIELDGFLKAHEIYEPYTVEEFEREQKAFDRLGF